MLQKGIWDRNIPIKDVEMKIRRAVFIARCTDPFPAEIRYDSDFWHKYITNVKNGRNIPHQNMHESEVKLMFSHVKGFIFGENEQRTLKGLLRRL